MSTKPRKTWGKEVETFSNPPAWAAATAGRAGVPAPPSRPPPAPSPLRGPSGTTPGEEEEARGAMMGWPVAPSLDWQAVSWPEMGMVRLLSLITRPPRPLPLALPRSRNRWKLSPVEMVLLEGGNGEGARARYYRRQLMMGRFILAFLLEKWMRLVI